MNSKKLYSLLLLFAISFSIMHDYTFAFLDNHHSSVKAYVSEFSADLDKNTDRLCKIHFEYHMPYTFAVKTPSIPVIAKTDSFFAYNAIFSSLKYFNFLKPPIA